MKHAFNTDWKCVHFKNVYPIWSTFTSHGLSSHWSSNMVYIMWSLNIGFCSMRLHHVNYRIWYMFHVLSHVKSRYEGNKCVKIKLHTKHAHVQCVLAMCNHLVDRVHVPNKYTNCLNVDMQSEAYRHQNVLWNMKVVSRGKKNYTSEIKIVLPNKPSLMLLAFVSSKIEKVPRGIQRWKVE